MSDQPKIWPPPPKPPSPAPEKAPPGNLGARWRALSPARRLAILAMAVVVVVVLIARGGDGDETETAGETPAGEEATRALPSDGQTVPADPSGTSAPAPQNLTPEEEEQRRNSGPPCDRFRSVASSPSGDELRQAMEEVNAAAATATQPVRDAARAVLDAVIEEDGGKYFRAGSQLARACREAGH